MPIQDAVPPSGDGGQPPHMCPQCGLDDQTRAVPALYEAAETTEAVISAAKRVIDDEDASAARKHQARATIAATSGPGIRSEALAPAPATSVPFLIVMSVLSGAAATILWRMYQVSWDTADPTNPDGRNGALHSAALGLTGLAAFIIVSAVVSTRRRATIRRGRAAAEAVWRRGWYCGRCGVVYAMGPGDLAAGVPKRLMSPAEFQDVVWTVGGYPRKRKR